MSDNSPTPTPPRSITDFATEFLADNVVAIIIKQQLLPDDVENPVIFPPTYLKAKGKAQDDEKEKKESKKEQQKSVYNLDDLGNGDNVCEIDSPQSDGNRSEPLFKSSALRHLVPQIEISAGSTICNLLDAGHRAGDALVRFSSLAAEFHAAFTRAEVGDHSALATLAPTSLLYGAWDSRSTQTKLQRIIKAGIRAQNVRPLTKSATFIPAVDYVGVGAIKAELDVGEGDSNPLSSEGMKHALASQTLGGVRLTDLKRLVRTIKINLVALRQLKAVVDSPKPEDNVSDERKKELEELKAKAKTGTEQRTTCLRNYILGLALTAATSDPDLNLREGCNLRIIGEDRWVLVRHRRDDEPITISRSEVLRFAGAAAKKFFEAMGIDFEKKDRTEVRFEKDVAEEFLSIEKPADRDKVRAMGPITASNLAKYKAEKRKRENAGDPVETIQKLIGELDPVRGDKFSEAKSSKLTKLREAVAAMQQDQDAAAELRDRVGQLQPLLTADAGAAARKAQMLALFPAAASEQSAEAPTRATIEATEESTK